MHLHRDIGLYGEIEPAILDLEAKIADRGDEGEIMALSDKAEDLINDLDRVDPEGADYFRGIFEDVVNDYMTDSEHAVNDALHLVGLGR